MIEFSPQYRLWAQVGGKGEAVARVDEEDEAATGETAVGVTEGTAAGTVAGAIVATAGTSTGVAAEI